MYRRILVFFGIMMASFCFSFFILDSISNKNMLKDAAINQQSYKLKVSDVRGTIYDCRNIPLVNTKKKFIAAVIPCLESLSALTPVVEESKKEELYKKCSGNIPFTIEISENITCPWIKVFEVPIRYSGIMLAPHIIGYISGEKKGVYGIEKAFEEYLAGKDQNISVRYDVDASGKMLPGGENVIEDKTYCSSKGVILNLDSRIQAIAEETANKYINKGSVVITQVPECEIRASVSLPSFFPGDVSSYLNDKNSPLLNRSFCSFNLGSIFKLVTSAAALEKGVNKSLIYKCKGVNEVENAKFKCFNCKEHGEIDMEQAIAYSCNGYFIELIKNLVSKDELLKMAYKLGLGKDIAFSAEIISKEGKLPSRESLENVKTLANFSFGQGALLATPIQIAGMINAIASEGIYTSPKLIKGLANENMQFSKYELSEKLEKKDKVLSSHIASDLKSFMKASVEYGTGLKGKPHMIEVGAKTSTAQTGIIENGKRIEQSWFAGFFPFDKPKYTVVVLSEGGEGGGESAGPIFKEIVERLYDELPEIFLED